MPFPRSLNWVKTALYCVPFTGVVVAGVSVSAGWLGGARDAPIRIVYAHYMHCFVYGYAPQSDKKLDDAQQAANDLDHWPSKDGAYREFWASDLAPSMRGGDSALVKDFELGQRAGLDAFGLLLNRGGLRGSFAAGLTAMFRVAEKNPVKVLPEIWDGPPKGMTPQQNEQDLTAFGNELKKVIDQYPDSVLRIHGKMAILLASVNSQNCQTLQPFFNSLGGMNHLFIIVYDSLYYQKKNLNKIISSPQEHKIAGTDGCAVSAVSDWEAASTFSDQSISALPVIAKAQNLILDWPVDMPFYKVWPDLGDSSGPQWASESLGAARFLDQWHDAIASSASLIDIQTWNDFTETVLTDTNLQGLSFIELNRVFSDWFHSGSQPAPTKDKLWMFYHHQLVNAEIGGRRSSDPQSRNNTPVTDFIEVVSLLKGPGQLDVQAGGAHYTFQAQAGLHDWILYVAPQSQRAAKVSAVRNEAQTAPVPNSYPAGNAFRSVQQIPALSPCLPVVTLSRKGQPSLKLVGRSAIQGKAPFEDLELIGSEITAP